MPHASSRPVEEALDEVVLRRGAGDVFLEHQREALLRGLREKLLRRRPIAEVQRLVSVHLREGPRLRRLQKASLQLLVRDGPQAFGTGEQQRPRVRHGELVERAREASLVHEPLQDLRGRHAGGEPGCQMRRQPAGRHRPLVGGRQQDHPGYREGLQALRQLALREVSAAFPGQGAIPPRAPHEIALGARDEYGDTPASERSESAECRYPLAQDERRNVARPFQTACHRIASRFSAPTDGTKSGFGRTIN